MRYVLPLRSTSFLIIGSHLRESRTGHLGSDPIIGANRVELVGVTGTTLPYPTAVTGSPAIPLVRAKAAFFVSTYSKIKVGMVLYEYL